MSDHRSNISLQEPILFLRKAGRMRPCVTEEGCFSLHDQIFQATLPDRSELFIRSSILRSPCSYPTSNIHSIHEPPALQQHRYGSSETSPTGAHGRGRLAGQAARDAVMGTTKEAQNKFVADRCVAYDPALIMPCCAQMASPRQE
jgi:hypothetical protein